jgi:hypothetical protein
LLGAIALIERHVSAASLDYCLFTIRNREIFKLLLVLFGEKSLLEIALNPLLMNRAVNTLGLGN